MNRNINRFLAGLTVFAVLLANAAMSFAEIDGLVINFQQEDFEEEVVVVGEDAVVEGEIVDFEGEPLILRGPTNTQKQATFLRRINDEFNLSKSGYQQLLNQVSDTKARLKKVIEDKMTLKEQLQNLDDRILITQDKLLGVVRQIVETENDIMALFEEIEIREVALEYQKSLLKDYIQVIYEEENSFLSFNDSGELDAFKLLLSDGTVGMNLKEIEYFDLLNEAGQQMVDRLDKLARELIIYQNSLNKKRSNLMELQAEVEDEKKQLEFQKAAKQNLLSLTMGQEQIYSQLLEQTQDEQAEMLEEIRALNETLIFVQEKIAVEGRDFNPDDYEDIFDFKTRALLDFQFNYSGDGSFVWPVEPGRGISAYFRDPSYVGVFGIQHNAIDIPIYQGSPVRSTGDGVVYTAKDNGYGYSYIIVAHTDGLMSVYGHISSILVDEGQTVSVGSIIALSGGMPGTKGSGYMTTGPHLHFEMKSNGQFVDPLEYLPLDSISETYIGKLPEKYLSKWEEAVYGVSLVERF